MGWWQRLLTFRFPWRSNHLGSVPHPLPVCPHVRLLMCAANKSLFRIPSNLHWVCVVVPSNEAVTHSLFLKKKGLRTSDKVENHTDLITMVAICRTFVLVPTFVLLHCPRWKLSELWKVFVTSLSLSTALAFRVKRIVGAFQLSRCISEELSTKQELMLVSASARVVCKVNLF